MRLAVTLVCFVAFAGCTTEFDPALLQRDANVDDGRSADLGGDARDQGIDMRDQEVDTAGPGCQGQPDGTVCGTNGRCTREACCEGCWDAANERCIGPAEQSEVQCGSGGLACVGCLADNPICSEGVCGPEVAVRTLSLGVAHACLIDGNAQVRCFGSSTLGATGGAVIEPLRANPVPWSDAAESVGASDSRDEFRHSCAVLATGQAQCWGQDNLALGGPSPSVAPVAVSTPGEGRWSRVSVHRQYSCGLFQLDVETADVYCWGTDGGRFGLPTWTNSQAPVRISGRPRHYVDMALGVPGGIVAESTAGGLRLHSFGTGAMLGRDEGTGVRAVDGLTTVTDYDAGSAHALAVTASGQLFGWGERAPDYVGGRQPPRGQLGGFLLDLSSVRRPRRLDDLPDWGDANWVRVAAGVNHSCGMRATEGEHTVDCWGSNDFGQLGRAEVDASTTPVRIQGLPEHIADVVAGGDRSCVITDRGALWCWGAGIPGGPDPVQIVLPAL